MTRRGIRSGFRGGGVAFHLGGRLFATAAHCIRPGSRDSIVHRFGTAMRVVDVLGNRDVAILTLCGDGVDPVEFKPAQRALARIGSTLTFTSCRDGVVQGSLRVIERRRHQLIAEPISGERPFPGDSGAPVCLPGTLSLIGLISGGIGPGILQSQIVIERLTAADVRWLNDATTAVSQPRSGQESRRSKRPLRNRPIRA